MADEMKLTIAIQDVKSGKFWASELPFTYKDIELPEEDVATRFLRPAYAHARSIRQRHYEKTEKLGR